MNWKDEFEKKMFYSQDSREALLESIDLKYKYMPEILYKYRTISDNTLNAIGGDFLIASASNCLNDIQEGRFYADFDKCWRSMYAVFIDFLESKFQMKLDGDIQLMNTRKEANQCIMDAFHIPLEDQGIFNDIFSFTEESMMVALKEFEDGIISVSNDVYRVCSLSASFDSNTMWSHYADEHKGICLGYGIKESNDQITALTYPVRYSNQMIEINPNFMCSKKEMNGILQINALSIKSTDWIYENEWRIIVSNSNGDTKEIVKLPVLKELILGANISEENIGLFKRISDEKGVKLFKMNKRRGSYKLEKVLV